MPTGQDEGRPQPKPGREVVFRINANITLPRRGLVLLVTTIIALPTLFFVWLIVRPAETERLTLRSDGTRRYMIDSAGHRLSTNRYTQTLRVGEAARCKVRHFPILMEPVIEACTPIPH